MKKTIQILDYNDSIEIEENNFTSKYNAIQDWVVDIVKVTLENSALEKYYKYKKEWTLDDYLEDLLSRQGIVGVNYNLI